jgi:hypothetical protein
LTFRSLPLQVTLENHDRRAAEEEGSMVEANDQNAWISALVDTLRSGTIADNRLEDAIVIKQPHLPKKIYKYRGDSTNSISNITTDTVWVASPDAYNDPFDCSFKVAEAELVESLKRSTMTQFASHYGLSDEEATVAIENALNSDRDPLIVLGETIASMRGQTPGSSPSNMAHFSSEHVFPQMVRNTVAGIREFRKAMKLCSFSEANDSILMWGHYAQNHKGFCVEYDIEPLPPEHALRRNLYPVLYSPHLYDMTQFVHGLVHPNRGAFSPTGDLLLSVLHKFDGWQYEREWRAVIFTPGALPDQNSSVPKPSRVFLGAKMDVTRAAEVAAICIAQNIEVWQMTLAPDRFELVAHPYVPPS